MPSSRAPASSLESRLERSSGRSGGPGRPVCELCCVPAGRWVNISARFSLWKADEAIPDPQGAPSVAMPCACACCHHARAAPAGQGCRKQSWAAGSWRPGSGGSRDRERLSSRMRCGKVAFERDPGSTHKSVPEAKVQNSVLRASLSPGRSPSPGALPRPVRLPGTAGQSADLRAGPRAAPPMAGNPCVEGGGMVAGQREQGRRPLAEPGEASLIGAVASVRGHSQPSATQHGPHSPPALPALPGFPLGAVEVWPARRPPELRIEWRKVGGESGGHQGNTPALKEGGMDSTPPQLRDKPRAEFLMNKVGGGLGWVDTLAVSVWQLRGWPRPTWPHGRPVSHCSWGDVRAPRQGGLRCCFSGALLQECRVGGAVGGADMNPCPSAPAWPGQKALPTP